MNKKYFKLLTTAIVFIVLSGGTWYAYDQFNSPAQGTVMSLNAQNVRSIVTFNMTPVKVTSQLADFSYPQALMPLPTQPVVSPELAIFNYGYKDTQSWLLAISITALNGTTLSADSSYLFRKDNPQTYQATNVTYGTTNFVIMKDLTAGGFSEIAFAIDGSRSADISLTGVDADGNQHLQATFATVLKSWQWR